LLLADTLEVLGLLEEALSSGGNLGLVDTPVFTKSVEDVALVVEHLDGTLLGNVLQSDNTVGDATALDDANPSDLRGVIGVGSTAGFGVHSSDVDHSQGVSRDNSTLVESVSVLLFSLSLVHERLGDLMAFVNKSVSLVLDVHLLLLGQALEVGNVQMSLLSGLLGSSLPDVGSEHFTAGSKYEMSSSVMGLELSSALHVDFSLHGLSDNTFFGNLFIQAVKDALAYLNHIHDFVLFALNSETSSIIQLATGGGVESTLVKDNKVPLVLLKFVNEYR